MNPFGTPQPLTASSFIMPLFISLSNHTLLEDTHRYLTMHLPIALLLSLSCRSLHNLENSFPRMSTPRSQSQNSSSCQTWGLGRVRTCRGHRHACCPGFCGWFGISVAAAKRDVRRMHRDSSTFKTTHVTRDNEESRWNNSRILAPN